MDTRPTPGIGREKSVNHWGKGIQGSASTRVLTSAEEERSIEAFRDQALRRFNAAFGLMTIIPLLICLYFATVRISSIDVLIGLNGFYFVLIIIIALLGLLVGRSVLLHVIRQLAETSTKLQGLVRQELELNERLRIEVIERQRAANLLRRHRELLEQTVKERTEKLVQTNEKLTKEIIERKYTETRLRSAHDKLSKTHEDLKSTQLQLIQAAKLESVGRLAAGVAHEVKNPLSIIIQGVDYLSRRSSGNGPEAEMALKDIREAVGRADGIIQELLNMSVPGELEMRGDDLNQAVEQALLFVKHELNRNGIRVVKELAGDLPQVRLDKPKIEQVFVNIFMNAIQAMVDHGTLFVRTSLGVSGNGHFALVEVDDTGPGIPEEILEKIFEPFFTTSPQGKGTGLGLAVTRKIVDMHGGRISIANRPEGGARIRISLSLSKGEGGEKKTHSDN